MSRHFHILITTCLSALCLLNVAHAAEKWSRQLEPTAPGVADSFDWVPVAQPVDGSTKDRSANARVLTYSQAFPPNGRFGELPKPHNPPSTQQHQSYDFPFQYQRFANAQPPSHHQQQRPQSASLFSGAPLKSASPLQSGEPTSQSFFKFEMPYRSEGGNHALQAGAPGSLQTGYQIQHTFGGGGQATLFSSPLFNQQPVFPPEFHPLSQKPLQQPLQKPLPQQNFIEDAFATKNSFREVKPVPTQQALQSVTPQVFPADPAPETLYELNKPTTFQAQPTYQQPAPAPATAESAPNSHNGADQQDVQLLYVPYDTLYTQQRQNSAFDVNKFNVNPGLPTVNPYQINQFYTQDSLSGIEQNFYTTSTTNRPPQTTSLKPTTVFHHYAAGAQPTTPKPKPKAHQPPLAMFLARSNTRPTQSDVVSTLRHANNIAVIDAPTKQIPEIFVGPAGMPIPEGYVKFDLPYLSQLAQTRELREVPFFVAPLSYRTPSGFNKILLPEPHVGSIVVNLAKSDIQQEVPKQQPPQPNIVYSQNDLSQQYQPPPPPPPQRARPHRVKQPSAHKEQHYNSNLNNQHYRDPYEVTTQRATLAPSRGNKFNYFYNQDAIHEVTSPKITKHDRPKKKRPQHVQVEQPTFTQSINNPYAQFQPAPNQIVSDDFYKLQNTRPSSTSTSSTSSTSTTTSSTTSTTQPPPTTFFTYNTNPEVNYQSTNGHLYPNLESQPQQPAAEEHIPRFTTRPPPSTAPEEEYRMKQYYRQQDAFRNRPQLVNPTNPPFEQVQYTPVDLDYDREVSIPSTTQRTTSTTKQRVTFYTPTTAPADEDYNTVPPQPQIVELQRDKDIQTELKLNRKSPANHRPSYNQNEIPDSTVEYDPNPYQLPSELPPLTPNLPGLVNNLQEKDKQTGIEQGATVTPDQKHELPTRPSRRPISRVRKPVVSKVTSSVSYSESESSSKRPSQRVRRPYGSRGSASAANSLDTETDTTASTRRPSSAARNPLLRNPNRIRYQPTPEERQTLRTKNRKKNGSKKGTADEDLDYQRDVLNQNYPVIKPLSSRTPTSPTAIPSSYAVPTSTEGPTSESQQIYTVTPSNSVDNNEQTFPAGLLEPMQIAQQYSKYTKDNYGPGYFPNQEDLSPTEPVLRNEINPVFTTAPSTSSTSTTTTTEEPPVTTRRSPFIRRNYPRLRSTTTETPTTTTPPIEAKSTRARIPPRKVIKVRARTRRPLHPASSTTVPEDEPEEEIPKNNLRKINRFNHDLYETDSSKRRYRPTFQLEGQESKWSPALKAGSNHQFKPSDAKDMEQTNQHNFEDEPEIVTIAPEVGQKDNFEVSVSANLGSASVVPKPELKAPNLKPEKSFAELLEEVMGKAPDEKPLDSVEDSKTHTTDGTFFESQKTTIGNRINRRNKFKKLTTNNESFETAESQNLGAQLYNSLYNNASGQQKTTDEIVQELRKTTPLTTATPTESSGINTMATTTPTPVNAVNEYELTTTQPQVETTTAPTTPALEDAYSIKATTEETESVTEEGATRRIDEEPIDDLESQPSIFSEVKKQLHELFAIDDTDDQAVTAALAAVGKRRQEYTNIKRTKPDTTTQAMDAETPAPTTEPTKTAETGKKEFHKNLMEHVVYATSTSTKVTSETEICYRGRCIRSEDLPPNHKLV